MHGFRPTALASLLAVVACSTQPPGTDEDSGSTGAGAGTGTGTAADSGADSQAQSDEGPEATGSTGDAATYTYHRDVAPIVAGRCLGCHASDGVAPFVLETYEDVSTLGAAVVAAVQSGGMPPFPGDSDCNEYRGDTSLTDAQIETIRVWVDEGTPEGDPADVGPPLTDLTVELPRVDLEVAMAEPHIPVAEDAGGYDEHICFLLDWPLNADAFIRGYEVVPTNRRAAHHLVANIVPPEGIAEFVAADEADPGYGWRCGAGTGNTPGDRVLLGAWVPGLGATLFPEDTGLRVPAGSAIMINMHYNLAPGDDSPDQTAIRFMVEDSVAREGRSLFVLDPSWPIGDNMLIPAGATGVVHQADFGLNQFGNGVEIHQVGMHMHNLGRQGRL